MRKLNKKQKRTITRTVAALVVAAIAFIAITVPHYVVLDAKGPIGQQQRNLLVFATALSLFVIIPVFVLTFYIVWKFREHKQSTYTPDWEGSKKLETLWWGLPTVIILILSVVTWQSTHALDPFKPLNSDKRPITIQVIALQWKWLFIYPEQSIATVNYVQFPVDTPVNFQITSDAPMNSFWIPQLGGQIYAMAGMSTNLHLQANELGRYRGSSANLSGAGFSGMHFTAQASKAEEFDLWSRVTQLTQPSLNREAYETLAGPSEDQPVTTYNLQDPQLYNEVINKYMSHDHQTNSSQAGSNHHETEHLE
jgi:cytochrome o ubiquinol oxidase subunit 2